MKKALLISNIAIKFSNFIVPPIEVLNELGYEVHTCANYSNFQDDKSKYKVIMHHIDFKRNPFNLKNIKAYMQLKELIKREKFDMLHCNTPIGGLLGRICGKKNNISRIIYTAHGFHFYKGAPLLNRTLYMWVERWLAKYTDILITINKEDYESAKKLKLKKNGKAVLIHGVGIDTDESNKLDLKEKKRFREKLGLSDTDIVCIAVGELNKNKNQQAIIKAIKQAENQKLHLLICGSGKEEKKLRKLVHKLEIEQQIHFLGYRKDILELLNCADIFIQLSYREGLSRSIMEAMCAELPCIVSEIRGNIDLIKNGEGGFLHNPKEIKKITNSLLKLANNLELRKKMGKFNKINIEKYSKNSVKEELFKIYGRLEGK